MRGLGWIFVFGCGVQTTPTIIGTECGVPAWLDRDGDGVGAEAAGSLCAPEEGVVFVGGDCDDGDPDLFPGNEELCDGVDNDCDGVRDEGHPLTTWYPDDDDDGFGNEAEGIVACAAPVRDWIDEGGDCDDGDRAVRPNAREICNGGIDDDCDGVADLEDDSLDLTTARERFVDGDGDGYGNPSTGQLGCTAAPGEVDNGDDCDDAHDDVNPVAPEVCDQVDNDCDGLVDDADGSIDPGSQSLFSCDADGDGLGDAVLECLACRSTPGVGVNNRLDCDDADPLATVEQDWYEDADEDGVGVPPSIVFQCLNPNATKPPPNPPLAPEVAGIDCGPDDPDVYPGAPDPLGDGIDQDCDTVDG